MMRTPVSNRDESVSIRVDQATLMGDLRFPPEPTGVVLFSHGSGSGRNSPRNQMVAQALRDAGLATLLLDLLTVDEEIIDASTRHLRFDIPLLADRLTGAIDWLQEHPGTQDLDIGCFGAST